MGKAYKGGDFEREFCKELSRWWTGGHRDDVFWRTAGSGARATVRSKVGKNTANSYGDIAAIDPVGQPLIDLVTMELKRGYMESSAAAILDKPDNAKQQTFEAFLEQTLISADEAGSLYWWLVSRRDRKVAMLWMPDRMWVKIRKNFFSSSTPKCHLEFYLNAPQISKDFKIPVEATGVHLSSFFEWVTPTEFIEQITT